MTIDAPELSTACQSLPRTPSRLQIAHVARLRDGGHQAGLRQLMDSASSGLMPPCVAPKHTVQWCVRHGADCPDKATSSSNAYFLVPKEPEKSRLSREGWPLAWPSSWSAVRCQ